MVLRYIKLEYRLLLLLVCVTQFDCAGRPTQDQGYDGAEQEICSGANKLIINGKEEVIAGTFLESLPPSIPSYGIALYFRFISSSYPEEVVLTVSTASSNLAGELLKQSGVQNSAQLDNRDLRVEISSIPCSIWTNSCTPSDLISKNQNGSIKGWLKTEMKKAAGNEKPKLYGSVCAEATTAGSAQHPLLQSVKLFLQQSEVKVRGTP
jgi:hypothetical protein